MAKAKSLYICSSCGYESAKWYGCCPGCGEWNTMNEEAIVQHSSSRSGGIIKPAVSLTLDKIENDSSVRYKTGLGELDRVLGGGIVKGSLILLSGDPGIGKSTLLLQICQYLDKSLNILYISGEESERQLKLRAQRLHVAPEELMILSETRLSDVVEAVELPGERFAVGVQWHPEELTEFKEAKALFRSFVEAAAKK